MSTSAETNTCRQLVTPLVLLLLTGHTQAFAKPAVRSGPTPISSPSTSVLMPIGLQVRRVQRQLRVTFALDNRTPLFVEKVVNKSEAFRAGLRHHDIILSFNGQAVDGVKSFSALLSKTNQRAELRFEILRRGVQLRLVLGAHQRTATVVLREKSSQKLALADEAAAIAEQEAVRSEEEASSARRRVAESLAHLEQLAHKATSVEALGLRLEPISQQLASTLGRASLEGAFVASINRKSAAYAAGLRDNDLLTSINEQAFRDPVSLHKILLQVVGNGGLRFRVERGKTQLEVLVITDRSLLLEKLRQQHEVTARFSKVQDGKAQKKRANAKLVAERAELAGAALASLDPRVTQTPPAGPAQVSHQPASERLPPPKIRIAARYQSGPALVGQGVEHGGHFAAHIPISHLILIAALETGFSASSAERGIIGIGLGREQLLTQSWSVMASAEIGVGIISIERDAMKSTDYTVPSIRADLTMLNKQWSAGLDVAMGLGVRALLVTADGGESITAAPELHIGLLW